jgi:hypothetical protein
MPRPHHWRLLAAALAIALSTASPAGAHITLENREATVGSSYKAVFVVPHGCAGSATVKIRVQIPDAVRHCDGGRGAVGRDCIAAMADPDGGVRPRRWRRVLGGGLLPLAAMGWRADTPLLPVLHRFSRLAVPVVAMLVLTGLTLAATLGADGYWHVRKVPIPYPGRWHMRIDALVSDFKKVTLEDEFDVAAR